MWFVRPNKRDDLSAGLVSKLLPEGERWNHRRKENVGRGREDMDMSLETVGPIGNIAFAAGCKEHSHQSQPARVSPCIITRGPDCKHALALYLLPFRSCKIPAPGTHENFVDDIPLLALSDAGSKDSHGPAL